MSDERCGAEQRGPGAATAAYPASGPGEATQAYRGQEPAHATQAYGATPGSAHGPRHGLVAGQEIELGGRALRIVRLISGGTGEADVHLVEDGAARTLALKLYREFSSLREEPNEEALARILELEHEDILRLHDFGTGAKKYQGRFCYELSTYAAGGDLLDVPDLGAKYSPMFVEEQVVPQILAGISTLHRHRIFHCDLKPRNVFYLDASQRDLVIGDYGSAKTWDQAARGVISHTSITKGSQLYMAPEQGQGMVSEKNDYYSFGMIVLHLLYPEKLPEGARWATFLERQLAEREIIDFDPRLRKFNALITGLTLRDWRRRWGRDEVQRWLRGDIAEVRLGEVRATIKLGRQSIASKGELVAYVEGGTEWYEVLIADRGGRQALLEWMDKTEGIQPRQAFDRLVRAAEPRGVVHVRETILRFLEPHRSVVIDGTSHDLWGSTDPEATAADALRQLEAAYRVTEADQLALWAFQLELALRGVAQRQDAASPGAAEGLARVDAYRKALAAREEDRKATGRALAAASTSQAVRDIIDRSQDWPDLLADARAALPKVIQGELRRRLDLARSPAEIQTVIAEGSDWPEILADARASLARMTREERRRIAARRVERVNHAAKGAAHGLAVCAIPSAVIGAILRFGFGFGSGWWPSFLLVLATFMVASGCAATRWPPGRDTLGVVMGAWTSLWTSLLSAIPSAVIALLFAGFGFGWSSSFLTLFAAGAAVSAFFGLSLAWDEPKHDGDT